MPYRARNLSSGQVIILHATPNPEPSGMQTILRIGLQLHERFGILENSNLISVFILDACMTRLKNLVYVGQILCSRALGHIVGFFSSCQSID